MSEYKYDFSKKYVRKFEVIAVMRFEVNVVFENNGKLLAEKFIGFTFDEMKNKIFNHLDNNKGLIIKVIEIPTYEEYFELLLIKHIINSGNVSLDRWEIWVEEILKGKRVLK